ncbi:MAG: hypothetical protein WEH44_08575, partial [Pirellulaceae bacterium]
ENGANETSANPTISTAKMAPEDPQGTGRRGSRRKMGTPDSSRWPKTIHVNTLATKAPLTKTCNQTSAC